MSEAALFLAISINFLAGATQPAREEPAPSNERQPYYVSTPFRFDDVDLATLERRLARFGFDVPFEVDGAMSVRIRVQWPFGALANRRAYRFQGSLTSDELEIAGLSMRDFAADLDYADGVLRLSNLDFQVPDPMPANQEDREPLGGRFRGTGSIAIWPRGDLRAALEMQNVALETLLPLVAELETNASGRITGQVSGRVPAERIAEPAAWAASGRVSVADFVTAIANENLPALAAETQFRLSRGVLTLNDLAASTEGAGLSGTARLELADPFPFRLNLGVAVRDADLLNDLSPLLELPVDVVGSGRGTAEVIGNLTDQVWSATGQITTNAIALDDFHFDRVGFDYRVDRGGELLTLANVAVDAYGGQARGEARLDIEQQLTAQFSWSDLRAGDLLNAAFELPVTFIATTRGTLNAAVAADQLSQLEAWRAAGTLATSDSTVDGVPASVQRAQYTFVGGTLRLENVAARVAEIPVSLTGTLATTAPYDFRARLRAGTTELRDVRKALDANDQFAELLSRIPNALVGQFTTAASLRGTLEPLAISGTGLLRSNSLRFASIVVSPFEARYELTPELVTLRSFTARIAEGEVSGAASFPIGADATGTAQVRWQDVRIGPIVQQFVPAEFELRGQSAGHIDAIVPPAATLSDVNAWQADGELSVTEIAALGTVAARANARWQLADGQLALEQLTARVNEADVRVAGKIGMQAPFNYTADLSVAGGELAKWQPFVARFARPMQLSGQYEMTSQLRGSLEPLEVTGQGSGTASAVQLGSLRVDQASFNYQLEPQQVRFADTRVELYGGHATASAALPLDSSGAAAVDFQWHGINAGDAIDDLGELPVDLEGVVSGSINASAEPGSAADWSQWTVAAHFAAPKLTANSITIGELEADLNQRARELTFDLAGQLMDGTVRSTARWYPVGDPRAAESEANVQLTNVRLSRLGDVFPDSERLAPLSGLLNARVNLEPQASGSPRMQGQVQIEQLEWGRTRLTDRVQGLVTGDADQIRLTNFGGPFAQGRLGFAANIPVKRPQDTRWEFSLRGARISESLLLVWPDLASWAGGTMDVQLRGRAGNEWTSSGTAALREATVSAVRVRGVRLPVRMRFDPRSGRGEIVVHGGSAQFSGGRITGQVRVRLTPAVFIDGDLRFTNLDLAALIRELNYSGRLGTGRIDGSVRFGGDRVESLRDINGQLQATLRQTQAFSFPVLQQIRPYVAGISGATTFERGEVDARMRQGVIFVEQLTLSSSSLQMFAEGRVTPAGRLDLSVIASTSQLGQDVTLARWLLERLPLAAPAPVGLIMTANRYLADRVLYFDVGGSIRNPVIRLRPLPIVRDAVVRFFLEGAVQGL